MEKRLTILGFASLSIGCIAVALSALSLFYFPYLLFYALLFGFLGFVITNIYLLINIKYEINKKTFNPGIIGIVLNSIPVLLIIYIKYSR